MRKMAAVFVVAVLAPTLILAWLAMGSLRDQEIVANSQRAILLQRSSDALAADLNTFMDDVRVFFHQLLDDLMEEKGAEILSSRFDQIAPQLWQQCSAASVVTDQGQILCPTPASTDPRARVFLKRHAPFLLNQSNDRFYEADPLRNSGPVITANRVQGSSFGVKNRKPAELPTAPGKLESTFDTITTVEAPSAASAQPASGPASQESDSASSRIPKRDSTLNQTERSESDLNRKTAPDEPGRVQLKVEVAQEKLSQFNSMRKKARDASANRTRDAEKFAAAFRQEEAGNARQELRKVQPSQSIAGPEGLENESPDAVNWSQLQWGMGSLRDIVAGKPEGALSRFLQDGLRVMLWKRHPLAEGRIFWVELDLEEIKNELAKILTGYASNTEVCLALLDAEGQVVAKTKPDFSTDWSRPFVASEVGQILPHWEVAAYLLDPDSVNQSAKTARLLIWLLVPTLLAAIATGTILIFRSIDLEMRLARRKTDFVSNVSHELKTPLTSIRMFSDLLTSAAANEKDREYSGIISREAARLTRLINNLLDFSRLEREDKPYSREQIDLADLTRETVETYRMQLESEGCRLVCDLDAKIRPQVAGDRDALAQVLLNLLSNAEKYGGGGRSEIRVELDLDEAEEMAEWRVLDRGPGVDRKDAGRIFEKFFRVNDSLSDGIPGSGLGLALAKQIVTHHGGSIFCRNREGGGSCFTVRLPVADNRKNPMQ